MPKKTRDYRSWRQEKLTDPEIAEGYLNSALEDSPQMFLKALLNLTQAQQNMATVAQKAAVTLPAGLPRVFCNLTPNSSVSSVYSALKILLLLFQP